MDADERTNTYRTRRLLRGRSVRVVDARRTAVGIKRTMRSERTTFRATGKASVRTPFGMEFDRTFGMLGVYGYLVYVMEWLRPECCDFWIFS